MPAERYFLLEDEERNVIVHGESGLRVNVFGLDADRYEPTEGEIHIFGEAYGEWLAFETDGWTLEDVGIISDAVLWYARYLGYPEMQITETDPRQEPKLKVLK